jgi:hypothetical protein
MHSPAITVDALAPCGTAAQLMNRHRIGSLLVTQGDDLVGIVTRADLMRRGVSFDLELPGCRCACCGSIDHLHADRRAPLCADCRDRAGPSSFDDELGGGD